ncbi:hypothetical protein F2Q69_00035474 [Brassica cretica]|uniref:Uncharacterized protein n=1 Tax=Brassica cretica TaxID=69181 RepID=A0A8S9SR39_BRACR|nr:hypothetical protein F2Q69_00035474 [Brassica cretica]
MKYAGICLAEHYKKTAKILREKIVGISSEYRYSDDIPTKQVVGNNSSEFLLSSEIPRNFPTEFRGNKFPRKFRGPLFCRKCPRNIPRENYVGIFPRTFIDRCVLDIYTSIDRNIPTELFPRIIPRDIFLGIFRGTRSSEYSEGTVPRAADIASWSRADNGYDRETPVAPGLAIVDYLQSVTLAHHSKPLQFFSLVVCFQAPNNCDLMYS